jgi:hypothetical protein
VLHLNNLAVAEKELALPLGDYFLTTQVL